MAEQSSVKKTRKRKIENPYHQEKAFLNIPRLVFLSVILGVPILLLVNKDIILRFFQGHEKYPPSVRSLDSATSNSSFENFNDPHLKPMTFQFPHESTPRTFEAYFQPDVSSFYNDPPETHIIHKPQFNGLAGKFINMSPDHLSLYWDDGHEGVIIADMPPFQAVGTATFPVHKFFITQKKDKQEIVHRIHMLPDTNLYVYDAFEMGRASVRDLSESELELYHIQKNNLFFAQKYRKFTGRDWLSLYPLRQKPIYKMWNADYFGQQHWVTSSETHFNLEPPEESLVKMRSDEMHRDRKLYPDPRNLTMYRSEEQILNMTMTVLSCAPRVFEIKNFLSQAEVDHIIHMATGMKLVLSTTSGSDGHDAKSDSNTRTSHNSWVHRLRSPIVDSIYGRAADLMQIDEALLRVRNDAEIPEVKHKGSSAEELQLVHYAKSERYTAHHDFSYPHSKADGQPARFVTLLLYLNEGMLGGRTTFPRWINAKDGGSLSVKPEVGKAILFYDQLPDGNMDDFSQHAAEPVQNGEKWLINLWTWDPVFR